MKIKLLLFTTLVFGIQYKINATIVEIKNDNTVFSPDEVTVQPGDTVNFNIGTFHNVVEVSEETWNAGDTTSNGGFRLPYGGGEIVLADVGTYYYVCQPHASVGMKGIINVAIPTVIPDTESAEKTAFSIYPNPASDMLILTFSIQNSTRVSVELIDISGRTISSLIYDRYGAGTYTKAITLKNIEPGRYFVKYRTDTGMNVLPIIKL